MPLPRRSREGVVLPTEMDANHAPTPPNGAYPLLFSRPAGWCGHMWHVAHVARWMGVAPVCARSARPAATGGRHICVTAGGSSISPPSSETSQLRVGIALDALLVPAWQAKVVSDLLAAPFATLALVVLSDESADAPRGRMASLLRLGGLFEIYRRIDRRLFRVDPDAWAPTDLTETLAHVPTRRTPPDGGRRGAATGAPAATGDADLDVIVDLARRPFSDDDPPTARYGVWSYRCGDDAGLRSAAFFRQMYDRNPVSATTLTVSSATERDERVLYQSFGPTRDWSLTRTSNPLIWKSAEFVARRLADLHRRGWGYIEALPEYREPLPLPALRDPTPTTGQMIRFIARELSAVAARRVRQWLFGDERWYVAYRRVRQDRPLELASITAQSDRTMERFRAITSPHGRYYADPFIVEHDGGHYLFFEDYDRAAGRGVISWTSFDDQGRPAQPRLALERAYHLSYPFVFRWNGMWYMLPETGANRTIELYRAEDFPGRWTLDCVLVADVFAVDSTLLEHDGLWWLFANVAVPGASVADELCLFYSDSPVGEWTPHPMNPVVSDVRRARPGGRIFSHEGMLIRPAQDSSTRYGSATVLNRVTALTVNEYGEVPVHRIEPGWMRGNLATHTFNATSEYEVIDAVRRFRRRRPRTTRRGRLTPARR